MTPRLTPPQSRNQPPRARKPIRIASIMVLLVAVASLQWPAPPVAGQSGTDLPAVQQAAGPLESSAPSADTDVWQAVRVWVNEWNCHFDLARDEPGAVGQDTLRIPACESKDVSLWDWLQVQGTMRMSYPLRVKAGEKAEFTLKAEGHMEWESSESRNPYDFPSWGRLHARLATTAYSPGMKVASSPCQQEKTETSAHLVSGSGDPKNIELTCEYDPAVDFGDGDEASVTYHFSSGVTHGGGRVDVAGTVYVTYKRCTKPEDCPPPEKTRWPVLILPGIFGSYVSSTANHKDWTLKRGVDPDWLVIDPIKHTYDDLIKTLENVGYKKDHDLFIAAYDWRLTPGPAPVDGTFDGRLEGLTGQSITDDKYEYGVDYLGYWLKEAAEAWQKDHPGKTLEAVDVISHSTGGLVARSYIQSDAYGANFTSQGKTMHLPLISDLIMVAVPNRGASLPWQAMHNNFGYDISSRSVFAKMLNVAYQKVKQNNTIEGPDQQSEKDDITLDKIRVGGKVNPEEFIKLYVPTFRSLLATYDFVLGADGVTTTGKNSDANVRNDLLLDLNNGLDMPDRLPPADSSPFVDQVGKATVIYAENQSTPRRIVEYQCRDGDKLYPLDAKEFQKAPEGGRCYWDVSEVKGDDTVPRESAVGQFEKIHRVDKLPIAQGATTHTGLMSNEVVQKRILEILGVEFKEEDISTGSVPPGIRQFSNVLSTVSDPVEMFVVDGSGRRLGYSQGTGPVTEIPNSVWFGDADGIGWVFDAVQEPLSVEMTGLGEDYYVQVSVEQVGMTGGMEASGFLSKGQKKTAAVETEQRGTRTYLPLIQRNYKLPPAGWQTAMPAH